MGGGRQAGLDQAVRVRALPGAGRPQWDGVTRRRQTDGRRSRDRRHLGAARLAQDRLGGAPHTGLDLRRHSADDYAHHVDALRHGIHETPTTCTGCPVVATCGGGLYAHRFGRGNGFDNPSVYCADLARLIVGIRYRQRASARLATMELPRTGVQDAAATAVRLAPRLLDADADPAVPDVVDELLRRQQDVDRELMFTAATVAGRVHGKPAWQLLVDVEAASPESVVSTLNYPYVRSRVRDALAIAQPAAATACQAVLAAVAMTAAVRAGHPATLDVPVTDGALCLPGLGVLALPAASTARVISSARAGEFAVRPDVGEPWASTDARWTGGWRTVRAVDTGGAGLRFDDVDPARDATPTPWLSTVLPRSGPSGRRCSKEHGHWSGRLPRNSPWP